MSEVSQHLEKLIREQETAITINLYVKLNVYCSGPCYISCMFLSIICVEHFILISKRDSPCESSVGMCRVAISHQHGIKKQTQHGLLFQFRSKPYI